MSNRFIGRLNNNNTVLVFGDSDEENLHEITNTFKFPNISEEKTIQFEIGKGLASDEWFYLELDDEEQEQMNDSYLSVATSSTGYNKITPDEYDKLSCFYLISENKKDIIFNRITRKFCIESKTFIKIDIGGPIITKSKNSIEFNSFVDAFWNNDNKTLYFKKFKTIKPLFDGIEKYYRSATSEEVQQFLNNDFFTVSTDFKAAKVGSRALRNIAIIIDEENIEFSKKEVRSAYTNYANTFEEYGVTIDNGKFKITTPADLTKVISVLQQRLYKAPITGEDRVADHTKKIGA